LAAALGKLDLEELQSNETNVPIAGILATGKMNALTTRDQLWSLTRLLQERRQDSLNKRPRTSLA
jgi:hypothetical protein